MLHNVPITDVLDARALLDALSDGLVRLQQHPTLPLTILNYTERCQHDRIWNTTTRACRGLIIQIEEGALWETATVVARPFPKFFNVNEPGAPEVTEALPYAPATVTDKLDGSLGILYPTPEGPAIATRGSFTSEQALHATALLRERYPQFDPNPDMTYLFEVVYPGNRIVVDYGDTDDLFLLDILDTATGERAFDIEWMAYKGPWVDEEPHQSLAEALAAPPRPNAEGYVVWFPTTNERLKLKQDDYVALHRIVTGLTERRVWEELGAGRTVEEICEPLPEEFREWVRRVAADLIWQRDDIVGCAQRERAAIMTNIAETEPEWSRKAYAERAAKTPHLAPYLFMLLDGKDPRPAIWRTLRPAHVPFRPAAVPEEDACPGS